MNLKHYSIDEGFQEVLLYKSPNGKVKVEMFLRNETIWLTQQKIADLFGVERSVVTKHLRNVFQYNELQEDSACAKIAHVASDGETYSTTFYNLIAFLQFNKEEILNNQGKVSHEIALKLAEVEYYKFKVIQDRNLESDFDKQLKKLGV